MAVKTVATNRKAYHNYHIGESLEAGIALTGTELNAHIARYEAGSYMSHEPTRPRRLLLHRKQIDGLAGQVAEKGLTLVPTKLYLKGSLAKVAIALAKGKKLYDKRETIARREVEREIGRAVKRHTR